MSAYTQSAEQLNTALIDRIVPASLGIGAAGLVVAGLWGHPLLIFALSAASVYFTVSAIIGTGLFGAPFEGSGVGAGNKTDTGYSNTEKVDRIARACVVVAAFGGVMAGQALALTAGGYFILTLIGFYAGMTAIIGRDPIYGLLLSVSQGHTSVTDAGAGLTVIKVGAVRVPYDGVKTGQDAA